MQSDLYGTGRVHNLIRKDKRTFNGLYDQYAGALYGILYREVADRSVADELLRQTFVLAWQQLGQYERHKGSILIWLIRKCCAVAQRHTGSFVDLSGRKASPKGS